MNTKAAFAFYLLCLLVMSSCKEQFTLSDSSGPIVGSWVLKGYDGELTVMEKSFGLDSTKYGFRVSHDGAFLERKNVGWCGTPPIAYGNFSGEWRSESDSVFKISVAFWGGRENFNMRIVALSESELKFKKEWIVN